MSAEKRERIRALNDKLRRQHTGGRILVSAGIIDLGVAMSSAVIIAVRHYDNFDETNDPYGEHDFGALTVSGRRVFWKIDYYDQSLTAHAADPADANTCVRVLTLMLAEEY